MGKEEKDKKVFALRLNPGLFKEIERWAADEFRSVNAQIEYLLSKAAKERKKKIDKELS